MSETCEHDKCPRCGQAISESMTEANERTTYACGSFLHPDDGALVESPTCLELQLAAERKAREAAVAACAGLRAILEAVHELPTLFDEKNHAYKRIDCRSIVGLGACIGNAVRDNNPGIALLDELERLRETVSKLENLFAQYTQVAASYGAAYERLGRVPESEPYRLERIRRKQECNELGGELVAIEDEATKIARAALARQKGEK